MSDKTVERGLYTLLADKVGHQQSLRGSMRANRLYRMQVVMTAYYRHSIPELAIEVPPLL